MGHCWITSHQCVLGGEALIERAPVEFNCVPTPLQAGSCRLLIGARSDPFFAGGEGAFHDFQSPATTRSPARTSSPCAGGPDDMLGPGPTIGARATVGLRRDGALVQVDRVGNPSFNPFFVDELKNQFNAGPPVDDVADYLEPWGEAAGESRLLARRSQRHRAH